MEPRELAIRIGGLRLVVGIGGVSYDFSSHQQPPGAPAFLSPEAKAIAERVNEVDWYHVIDLPHGITTPGLVDHRQEVALSGLPKDMRGLRALDIATFDGFWAFEMERRGAEVVAIDVASTGENDIPLRWREELTTDDDRPTGAGFELAKQLLGSHVKRKTMRPYDLTPELLGVFDFVFFSDLLQRLRDPQRALESIYTVVRDDGWLVMSESYAPALEESDLPLVEISDFTARVWSTPSVAALKLMLSVAGFEAIETVFRLEPEGQSNRRRVVLHSRRAATV